MDELIKQMQKLLADTFVLYLKGHNYHWNVEGKDFAQLHDFFGSFYEEVHGSVDTTAEEIRAMDEYAPGTLIRFKALSSMEEIIAVPSAMNMIIDLYNSNEQLLQQLEMCNELAEKQKQTGLANYLQERIDVHKKHSWMLRAFTKG